MIFWDSSALAALLFEEQTTRLVQSWLQDNGEVIVWALTRVELVSAIERRAREGILGAPERAAALVRVERIFHDAHEVTDLAAVRTRAVRLLGRHPLRAADALQLAAALVVSDPEPSSLALAALDRRLAEAARAEGLRVLTA